MQLIMAQPVSPRVATLVCIPASVFYLASVCICFFFSSRRGHTRFKCDWSSDVCSPDLTWACGPWPPACGRGGCPQRLTRIEQKGSRQAGGQGPQAHVSGSEECRQEGVT